MLQSKLSEILSRLPPTYQPNPAVSSSTPPSSAAISTTVAFPDTKLNLVSASAPFELPYPDIIIF